MYFPRKLYLSLVLLGLFLSSPLLPAQDSSGVSPKKLKALDPSFIDNSVNPCTNFYQYSCGRWIKQNPIPADESAYGRDTELTEQNELVLKAILEKAASGGS